jgi:probable DNA metabolism protein
MRDLIEDGNLRELFDVPGLPEYSVGAGSEEPSGQGGHFEGVCTPPRQITRIPPELYELSVSAYNAAVLAALSELPLGASIPRFCRKALSAAAVAERAGGAFAGKEARLAAERVLSDRDDDDVRAVLEAAAKVTREIDRLRGLLRFRPDKAGIYVARCAPDHFVLPALAGHFELRFGGTPWAIIDEKRRLTLARFPGGETRLAGGTVADPPVFTENTVSSDGAVSAEKAAWDSWEELWRTYHRSVNNEARKNPKLQRQFMPERYLKYLTEI